MKILICDDDTYVIKKIQKNLDLFSLEHEISFDVNAFSDSAKVLTEKVKYDIAFIDIEMPKITGLKLTSHLKKNNKNIIVFIVTSYECYLDDAMDLEVFRYLSKPIDDKRFFRSLKAAIDKYHTNTQVVTLESMDKCYSLFTNDIIYITIENKKAVIITRQKKYLTNQRIGYWKTKLQDINYIVQIHYSFLVNMNYITNFDKTELHIKSDNQNFTLPISQRKYSEFKKRYFKYIGE